MYDSTTGQFFFILTSHKLLTPTTKKARIYSQKNAHMLRPSPLSLEFEEVHGPLVMAPPKPPETLEWDAACFESAPHRQHLGWSVHTSSSC